MSEEREPPVSVPELPGREREATVLSVHTHRRADGVVVLDVAGDVDAAAVGRFAEVVRAEMPAAAGGMVLDLFRVTLLSTAGVVVLTEAAHRALLRNVPVVLVTHNRHVELCGFRRFLTERAHVILDGFRTC